MWFLTAIGAICLVYYTARLLLGLIKFYRAFFTKPGVDFSKLSTAVITGASDGIGKAYAFELARYGMKRIVLVGRNVEKLGKVEDELRALFPNLNTRSIRAEFEETDMYDRIEQELGDLHDIDVLINNVGAVINLQTAFHEMPRQNVFKMLNINVTSCVLMSHVICAKMVADRRRGVVINVSSAAIRFPPIFTLYAPVKTFMSRFSEALRLQYRQHGILVQEVEPFIVSTKMARFVKGPFVVEAETFVKQALRTVGKSSTTTGSMRHEVQMFLFGLLPDFVFNWAIDYMKRRARRAAQNQTQKKTE